LSYHFVGIGHFSSTSQGASADGSSRSSMAAGASGLVHFVEGYLNVGRYADAGVQLLLWVNAGGSHNRDSWRVGRLSLSCGWEVPIELPDFQSVQTMIRGLLHF
jgi:hypothetical protein